MALEKGHFWAPLALTSVKVVLSKSFVLSLAWTVDIGRASSLLLILFIRKAVIYV